MTLNYLFHLPSFVGFFLLTHKKLLPFCFVVSDDDGMLLTNISMSINRLILVRTRGIQSGFGHFVLLF